MPVIRNALMRFRRMTPARLYQDHARARKLLREDVPVRPPSPARPERLVVTLTTIPERLPTLDAVLRSLLDQTCAADRIVVNWQTHALRDGAPYPPPPPLPAGIDVRVRNASGPATKLLPTLQEEPAAALIVVDDDVIYPVDLIEQMLAWHRRLPRAAIGWRGWQIVPGRNPKRFPHVFATALAEPQEVDILIGTWGYLVPPGAFDAHVLDFSGYPDAVRFVDDVWFSGHLARRGVPRLVIPGRGLPIETEASNLAALTFGPNSSGTNDLKAIEAFREWW